MAKRSDAAGQLTVVLRMVYMLVTTTVPTARCAKCKLPAEIIVHAMKSVLVVWRHLEQQLCTSLTSSSVEVLYSTSRSASPVCCGCKQNNRF